MAARVYISPDSQHYSVVHELARDLALSAPPAEGGGDGLRGGLDNMRVYSHALSQAELATIAEEGQHRQRRPQSGRRGTLQYLQGAHLLRGQDIGGA